MSVDELQALFDTPYSEYSNTNYPASGQDVHAITEILHQRRAQLHDVAAELAFVGSIVKCVCDVHRQLLDKRDQILASIRAHQGFVSCIRRLPPEILSEIFVRCLPPETHIRPETRAAPLLLMGVCRGWREVALETPRLWCSLSVRPGLSGQQGLLFYHDWLSRARNCPLSLAVDVRQPPQNPVWRNDVTELLQPFTSRAVQLHVTFDKSTVPDLLLKDMPMLEHLSLKGDFDENPRIVIVQPEPCLRSLTLDRIVFGADMPSAFDSYWTHLTQLRVTLGGACPLGYGNHGLLTLLALCPHLQDFTFSSVSKPRRTRYAARALTHSHLRSLHVKGLRAVGPLLDALTLPALRHLKITGSAIGPKWWENEFRAFVARSQCPLETLEIHGPSDKWENQTECMALIPTLKHVDYARSRSELEVAV